MSDKLCYYKVARAVTLWRAIEKSPILPAQYYQKLPIR